MPDELLTDQGDVSRSRRVSMMVEQGLVKNLQRYPRAIFFILGNEFCERFSFYGMRSLLMLYFISEHGLSNSTATLLYHTFTCIAYLSPLAGSVVADSYLGRFKVIFYVSILYVVGHALLSFGAVHTLPQSLRFGLDYVGLFVIAISTGGIKPCVSAFAADQFEESQSESRAQFFSFFYFSINAGSLFALALTPTLSSVQCFNRDCYALAFGVPGLLMLVALIVFILGWRHYKKLPPTKDNVAKNLVCCMYTAVKNKLTKKGDSKETPDDWLQHASPEYSDEMIQAARAFIDISIVFMPLVLFWGLFDQQGSTWVVQAVSMNTRLGPLTLRPQQLNFINPLLIIIFVPLCEAVIYPCAKKIVKVTPLRKMALGGLLAGLSFVIAGVVQLQLNHELPVPPSSADVSLWTVGDNVTSLVDEKGDSYTKDCAYYSLAASRYLINSQSVDLTTLNGSGVVVDINGKNTSTLSFPVSKHEFGMYVYFLVPPSSPLYGESLIVEDLEGKVMDESVLGVSNTLESTFINLNSSRLMWDGRIVLKYGDCEKMCKYRKDMVFEVGAVYVVYEKKNQLEHLKLIDENKMSVFWTVPQYMVITIGEILLSITGLEFAYSQSPPHLKSVLQATWLLTVFLGNLIDMAISGTHMVSDPAVEFFVYAALMFIVMAVFIVVAMRYRYKHDESKTEEDTSKEREESERKEERDTRVKSTTTESIGNDTPL